MGAPTPWTAHVSGEPGGMTDRLVLWRSAGNGQVQVLTPTGGYALVDETAALPDEALWRLPRGCWEAIVALAAPHADAGELAALREALTIERARVDRILGAEPRSVADVIGRI